MINWREKDLSTRNWLTQCIKETVPVAETPSRTIMNSRAGKVRLPRSLSESISPSCLRWRQWRTCQHNISQRQILNSMIASAKELLLRQEHVTTKATQEGICTKQTADHRTLQTAVDLESPLTQRSAHHLPVQHSLNRAVEHEWQDPLVAQSPTDSKSPSFASRLLAAQSDLLISGP